MPSRLRPASTRHTAAVYTTYSAFPAKRPTSRCPAQEEIRKEDAETGVPVRTRLAIARVEAAP